MVLGIRCLAMGLIKFGPYAKMKHLTTTRFRNFDPRLEKSTFPCSQNVLKEGFSKIAPRLGYKKSQKYFVLTIICMPSKHPFINDK